MAQVELNKDAMNRLKIYDEITKERVYQDRKWGGPEHDDLQTFNNWVAYIMQYATGWAWKIQPPTLREFRRSMVKVAALAVAAIEAVDRQLERKY